MSPTTHIKAQSKAARITTKSDSIATASGGGATTTVVGVVSIERRILSGRVILARESV